MRLLRVSVPFALALVLTAAPRDPATARKLLDGAVEMSAAVHPETGVAALMQTGIAYAVLDKKTGLALLDRAFSAVRSLSGEDLRQEYSSAIVRAAADLDVQAASELLRQLPNPASAATAIVRQLLAAEHFDQAMELLALTPEQVEYPFEAASHLIARLPKDDPRSAIAFGRATTAFARLPAGPFPALVERFGAQMPVDLRGRAISAMLLRIRDWKDVPGSFSGTADDGGDVELHSPLQNELRELVSVVRKFDPAAVDGIIAGRPDISAALAGFRKPRKPAEAISAEQTEKDESDDGPFSPPFGIGMADNLEGFQRSIEEYGRAEKQAEKVAELVKKDPAEAVRLARTLPDILRAEALAVIASAVITKDPVLAMSVVDSCLSEIERVGNPATRIPALLKLGAIYAGRKDQPRAYAAYERALADVIPLWSADTKAERPNIASRDTWPSTQAVRAAAYEAALNLGAGAVDLLSAIPVPDLALLARVHMARALVGLPLGIHNINVRWVEKDKQ